MELWRKVTDLGKTFYITVPDSWLEYPLEGKLLTLAGDVGQGEDEARPSIQISFHPGGRDESLDGIVVGIMELPQAEELGRKREENEVSIAVAHLGEDNIPQAAIVHAIWVDGKLPGIFQVFGAARGNIQENTMMALRDIVDSFRVEDGLKEG